MAQDDPYEVLQLSPKAHPLMVGRAFRLLASLFHPDNKHTGDREQFERVLSAYRTLSDPARRAAYDEVDAPGPPAPTASNGAAARRPLDDRRLRLLILVTLYNMRRSSLSKPGLSLRVLAEATDSPIDDVRFTLWYLRGKKLIEMQDDDEVAITVAGVDYLETQDLELGAPLLSLPEAPPALEKPPHAHET